ncbi:hypothetical protein [Paraburkholderia terrae]|uniref:hypothetical protein n=1 Tax=Paraburkholderia terrae TaxID=311230 RepID=UPI0020558E57|nr:hypothetical protein [Paraburkholderia terrae]BDC42977.1 hypothetical protein PTKU15_62740 [Paraburkholderia terrae]
MKRALLHVGVVALLAFFIGFATAATGKAPTEFRGIKWGSHPTGALKRIGGPSDDPEKLETWANRNKKLPDFSGIPVAEEGYSFAAGKLYGGQLYIDGDANFTNAKSELISRV